MTYAHTAVRVTIVLQLWRSRLQEGKVSTVFPRAVVWSDQVQHHQCVLVDHVQGAVTVNCYECDRGYELCLRDLQWLKYTLQRSSDVQVVAWVERYE